MRGERARNPDGRSRSWVGSCTRGRARSTQGGAGRVRQWHAAPATCGAGRARPPPRGGGCWHTILTRGRCLHTWSSDLTCDLRPHLRQRLNTDTPGHHTATRGTALDASGVNCHKMSPLASGHSTPTGSNSPTNRRALPRSSHAPPYLALNLKGSHHVATKGSDRFVTFSATPGSRVVSQPCAAARPESLPNPGQMAAPAPTESRVA